MPDTFATNFKRSRRIRGTPFVKRERRVAWFDRNRSIYKTMMFLASFEFTNITSFWCTWTLDRFYRGQVMAAKNEILRWPVEAWRHKGRYLWIPITGDNSGQFVRWYDTICFLFFFSFSFFFLLLHVIFTSLSRFCPFLTILQLSLSHHREKCTSKIQKSAMTT